MSVQAAICRVMKVRKEAGHRDLVAQVRNLPRSCGAMQNATWYDSNGDNDDQIL